MDDYISKPIDDVVLERRINFWWQKMIPQGQEVPMIPIAAVTIKPSNEVWNIQKFSKRLNNLSSG